MSIAATSWRELFTDWPEAIPRLGLVVTSLGDQTPFKNFWLRDELLLLERTVPDANGGRFVLLSFDVINSLKISSPLGASTIADAGFAEGRTAVAAR